MDFENKPLMSRDVVLKYDRTLRSDNLAKLDSFTLERAELAILVNLASQTLEHKDGAKQ